MNFRQTFRRFERFSDAAFVLIVLSFLFALFRNVLTLWWTWDDFFHLHHILTHNSARYLVDSQLWMELPFRLFTPLLQLSYESDFALFGLQPQFFYASHLAVLALAAVALYGVLRLWFVRVISLASTLLFVAGVPLNSWAQQLMDRHYVLGLLLSLISVSLFVAAARRNRLWLSFASAAFFLLAALAKEVYVPLPFVLLALPESTLRGRLRILPPQWVALVVYLGWRFLILETVFGGYGWAIETEQLPVLLFTLPVRMAVALTTPGPIGWMLLAYAGIVLAYVLSLTLRSAAIVVWCLGLLLLPLLAVSKVVERRYAVLPWLLVAVATAVAGQRFWADRPRWRIAIGAVLGFVVAAAVLTNRLEWQMSFADANRMSEEGRFFLSAGASDTLRNPKIPPAALGELKWLKEDYLKKAKGTQWFYDDLFLCDRTRKIEHVWMYDESARRVHEVSEAIPEIRRQHCSTIDWSAPLQASFRKRDGNLFWVLGPGPGEYAFVFGDGVQVYPVPKRDGFQIGSLSPLVLRIRYRSPGGGVTYSPELSLDFSSHPELSWRR